MPPEKNMKYLLSACFLCFALSLAAQENSEPEMSEPGFFISAGANFSQFSGKAFPVKFPFQFNYQVGGYFQFQLWQEYTIYSGMIFQQKGYAYDFLKTGQNLDGKAFEQKIKGECKISYLDFPALVSFPLKKPDSRWHLLAGTSFSLRVLYREKFSGYFKIPEDTLFIPQSYEKTGNDAFDFLDVNLCLGATWRLNNWLEIWALANRKAFGLSIGKENFATSEEVNTLFALQLVGRLGNRKNWLRF